MNASADPTPAHADLPPHTPVLIGVGEVSETLDSPDYRARSEAQLAADALLAAVADTGVAPETVLAAVDAAAMTRSFEAMGFGSPLGTPTSYPWAVLRRVGASPSYVVHDALGGQTPQSLVNELCQEVADGRHALAVVFGADVTSTTRHFTRGAGAALERPDFAEDVTGPEVDRGRGTHLVNTRHQVLHGMTNAPVQYALLEHARRHRLGLDRRTYAKQMAALLAPLSEVAAEREHAAAPTVRTAAEVEAVTADNRVVADPYRRLMVARDQVNQGAACVIASLATARALGVPEERWVFLHGHASLSEQTMLARPDLSRSPATVAAVEHALDVAGASIEDLGPMDLYSCFPIAITTVTDAFDLDTDDPRRLTLTGGLPFFGGAGSNYSLHAVAEVVRRVRHEPGAIGLVGANGGQLSKYAVGVYSARPRPWVPDDSAALQAGLDAVPGVPWTEVADGPAVVESFSVEPQRDGSRTAALVCRDLAGRRFLATAADDDALLDLLADEDVEPIGRRVHVRHVDHLNRAALTRATLDRLHPVHPPRLDGEHTRVRVAVDGPVVELALLRPLLDRRAHTECDEVVSAWLADPALRVLLLHADGPDFCQGLDPAEIGWGGTLVTPPHGVAGLTGRAVDRPVVAAVSGSVRDAGVELLMASHVVVADETATFEMTATRSGLVAEHGGLRRLREVVGHRLADDLVLTGRRLDAHEALAAGLVSRVVPAGDQLATARQVAEQVCLGGGTAVRATLRMAGPASYPASCPGRTPREVDEVAFSEDLMG
ncbi:enoyl-CoA hydratase-related protein [Nocardioides marinus]|uniref:Acetyl-CoA C-acetyltransferase n=1 Tax=Nocardioides marinus TaxID=374514 RepID=A0A7Y9YG32_9ACTN|nr:acetyl-CoA C-acetyltransferase [Nocardioides marinus]